MLLDYGFVILDGAMGTMLTEMGLKVGEKPEILNITAPEKVIEVHRRYIEAGSNIIYANTFGANRKKLEGEGYSVQEVITAAVENAKVARGDKDIRIALDLSTLGEMLEPMGTLSFEECYEIVSEQVIAGHNAGVDLFVIETVTDLYELKAGILAVKENSNKSLITTMSFEANGRTFSGCLPESFALTASSMGVDALGVNCSLGPMEIYPIIERIAKVTNKPLVVKANAGLPNFQGEYTMKSVEFAKGMLEISKLGVQYLGGCCGTDPSYIAELVKVLEGETLSFRKVVKPSAVCTPVKYVELKNFVGIGEKINPTGKKYLKEALLNGNMDPIIKEAI
ncbi:MAG: homocysteine S-methyltransferase family protein, partial [Gallicola sp.]|nr:homocysteine S-methyltransferase family protein [Gallicola sp.]